MKSCDKTFDELIASIKRKRTLAKQLIKTQEKSAVAKAEELQLQLEEEISKLRQRDTDLEQLFHLDDHIHFIQVTVFLLLLFFLYPCNIVMRVPYV